LRRGLKVLGIASLAVGVLAYPAAWAVDAWAGVDVLMVTAAPDEATVETNRGMWELNGSPKEEVASIYGSPPRGGGLTRLVILKQERILRPKEDPSLVLYLLPKDEHPVQAMTFWYFALPVSVGGILAGGALLLVARRMGRKRPDPEPAPAQAQA
jgi:hypothetical protein